MEAIESGGEPETSGEDNLGTLRVVHAAYRSAAEGRGIVPAGIPSALDEGSRHG
jgi:predicted dehydrogenase